jgi:hypothetical protein
VNATERQCRVSTENAASTTAWRQLWGWVGRALKITGCACISPLFVVLLSGCASQGVDLSKGTLLLGEVSHVLTTAQVEAGALGPHTEVEDLSRRIQGWGFTAQQIESGRVVVVREGIYWDNALFGTSQDMLHPALVPEGMKVNHGNIVEGVVGTPYTLIRVRAANLSEGKCHYSELPSGTVKEFMGAVTRIKQSGVATLYCKGIEADGWQRPR